MAESLGYQFDRVYGAPIERYRQVATLAERDAIPTSKRWEGMLCYVTSQQIDYQLRGGLTNLNWVEAGAGAYFDKNNDTSDDIIEGVTNLFLSNTDKTKLDYITVTNSIDLDQLKTDVDALGGGITFIDEWDASSGSFPGGGTASIGDFYVVSVAGTVDGVSFAIGDGLIAKVNNASTATFAGNWVKTESTSDVTSVVGLTGVITKTELLTALNVEDGATADQTGAEIVSAINTELTTSDWQTKLTSSEVMGFVDTALNNGFQSNGISLTYIAFTNALNLTLDPFVTQYPNTGTCLSNQNFQYTGKIYQIVDGTGFQDITSGRVWIQYNGVSNGLDTDYYIVAADQYNQASRPQDRILTDADVSGTFNLDYDSYEVWDLTLTGATTFAELNAHVKTLVLRVTGDFALTFPTGWDVGISGSYDGTVSNLIVVQYFGIVGEYKVQISQPD